MDVIIVFILYRINFFGLGNFFFEYNIILLNGFFLYVMCVLNWYILKLGSRKFLFLLLGISLFFDIVIMFFDFRILLFVIFFIWYCKELVLW